MDLPPLPNTHSSYPSFYPSPTGPALIRAQSFLTVLNSSISKRTLTIPPLSPLSTITIATTTTATLNNAPSTTNTTSFTTTVSNLTIPPVSFEEDPLLESARLGILFSGGLDCLTLAALVDTYLPLGEPIDLLNVAFENPRTLSQKSEFHPLTSYSQYQVPDRLTGEQSLQELKALYPNRPWRLVLINVSYVEYLQTVPLIQSLMNPLNTVMDLSIGIAFWFASRGIGLLENQKVFVGES